MEILISTSKEVLLEKLKARSPLGFSIGTFRFFLSKFRDQLVAFESHCPHSGYTLESATINPFFELVCPWHDYSFQLGGGEEAQRRCRNLTIYQIIEKIDGIYVVLPQDAIA